MIRQVLFYDCRPTIRRKFREVDKVGVLHGNDGFLDSQGNLIKSRNNKMTGSTESGKIKHVI